MKDNTDWRHLTDGRLDPPPTMPVLVDVIPPLGRLLTMDERHTLRGMYGVPMKPWFVCRIGDNEFRGQLHYSRKGRRTTPSGLSVCMLYGGAGSNR